MKRHGLGWLLYQPYKYLVVAPVLVLATAFFAILALVLSLFTSARTASRLAGVGWARMMAWVTPMRVMVEGRKNIDPHQSYVLVSNHQSQYDIFLLYGSAAIATLEAARTKIVDGTSVIFFPEGTRSTDGRLLRFKRGAFRMAIDLGLPILPITVTGTRDVLPANTSDLMPGSARLIIHEPIAIEGVTVEDCQELSDRVRAVIASSLPLL
jgi:1-acyl-sn-glycerol-3-phosphate acyltransferase